MALCSVYYRFYWSHHSCLVGTTPNLPEGHWIGVMGCGREVHANLPIFCRTLIHLSILGGLDTLSRTLTLTTYRVQATAVSFFFVNQYWYALAMTRPGSPSGGKLHVHLSVCPNVNQTTRRKETVTKTKTNLRLWTCSVVRLRGGD